jgi:NAD(P)-dependent dehydrogenase (short-subunit alcohol dehydrogenase family)
VYFTGRSEARAKEVIARCPSATAVSFIQADQSSLAAVKQFAETFLSRTDRLDVLITNAGIMDVPSATTVDGKYEIQFGTNHMSHALLIQLLLPTLAKAADPRLVILTSEIHTMTSKTGLDISQVSKDVKGGMFGYGVANYDRSKYANLVYGRELARRFPDVLVVPIHPGVVPTLLTSESSFGKRVLMRIVQGLIGITLPQGAFNMLWASVAARNEIRSGAYYVPVGVETPLKNFAAKDAEAKKVYDWTNAELVPFLA